MAKRYAQQPVTLSEVEPEGRRRRGLTWYGEMKPPLDLFAMTRPIRLRSASLHSAQGDSRLSVLLRGNTFNVEPRLPLEVPLSKASPYEQIRLHGRPMVAPTDTVGISP